MAGSGLGFKFLVPRFSLLFFMLGFGFGVSGFGPKLGARDICKEAKFNSFYFNYLNYFYQSKFAFAQMLLR